jgi:inositol 1,4,5-triphosphate receptor type 1/inositol 1,4,5-triphosphate receptor type 3
MIICSTFVVGFFLMKKGPLYAREAWDRNKELLKKDQACIVRFAIKGYMVLNSLIMVLTNIEVMYYLAYGVLAFIATLFHPFFFAFHMSEVVLRYPTMRNVIRSFWEPKTALFLTMMLIMVTNYYFSIFSYVYLYDLYVSNKGSKCDSLIVCFLSTFDYAFKNNGGIGGWFDGNAP